MHFFYWMNLEHWLSICWAIFRWRWLGRSWGLGQNLGSLFPFYYEELFYFVSLVPCKFYFLQKQKATIKSICSISYSVSLFLAYDIFLKILFQGRGIETNLYAQFKCDSLKIGMVTTACIIILYAYLSGKGGRGAGKTEDSCVRMTFQVKHPEVAQFLGGRLYDCVFKYNEVLS